MSLKDIRVLIIDDIRARRSIKTVLGRKAGIRVVGECSSAEEGILQIGEYDPDIILTDERVPGIDWIKTAGDIRRSGRGSGVEVIAFTESADCLDEPAKKSAVTYVEKNREKQDLVRTIREVHNESRERDKQVYSSNEVIELVVSPSSGEGAQILRFMYRLGEMIYEDIGAIVCSVGSSGEGSVITIHSKRTIARDLAVKLKMIPGVEGVEEEVPAGNGSREHAVKMNFLPGMNTGTARRLHITLREEAG